MKSSFFFFFFFFFFFLIHLLNCGCLPLTKIMVTEHDMIFFFFFFFFFFLRKLQNDNVNVISGLDLPHRDPEFLSF